MKGLLLKDLYMFIKYYWANALVMALFVILSVNDPDNVMFLVFPCVLGGSLPVTLLSYDERSHWNDYCGTMPCTKREVVSAKFIVALAVQGAAMLLILLVQGMQMAFTGTVDGAQLLMKAAMLCAASSASVVMLPLSFKYGVEKGSIAYYVLVGMICAVSFLVSGKAEDVALSMPAGEWLWLGLMAFAAVLYALCWFLSVRAYEKRER